MGRNVGIDGKTPLVYVVDDDHDVRTSISFMLGTIGRASICFSGGREFLDRLNELEPGCVLIDVRMPEIDGLQVLAEMERQNVRWPSVVMTGHGELWIAVRAMKLGAIDFLEKPFEEDLLLRSLEQAERLLADQ